MLHAMQKPLTARELYVLQQRRIGRTLKAIGDDLSVSRERIRQIELKALRKELHGWPTNLPDISLKAVRGLRRLPLQERPYEPG